MMDKEEITLDYKGFILLNLGQNGFYRVCYSPPLLLKLKDNMHRFDAVDRYGILSDTVASYEISWHIVDLLEGYKGEDSFSVWSLLESCIILIESKLSGTQRREKFKFIVNKLFGESFNKVGKFESNSTTDLVCITQGLIAKALGVFAENPEVIKEAVKKFKENAATDLSKLSPAIRGKICSIACLGSKFTLKKP